MWTLRGIEVHPTPSTGLVHPIPSLGCALMDIDIHTTAGKAADLARRIEEAIHSAPAAAVEDALAGGHLALGVLLLDGCGGRRVDGLFDPSGQVGGFAGCRVDVDVHERTP